MPSMHYKIVGASDTGYPDYSLILQVEFRNLVTDPTPFRERNVVVAPSTTLVDLRETLRDLCREENRKQTEAARVTTAVQPRPVGVVNYEETFEW